jgi:hypothetical protein
MLKRAIPHPLIADLADRAFRHGVSIVEVRDRAQPPLAASTWMRWVRGQTEPQPETIDRLNRALDQIIKEDDHGQGQQPAGAGPQ